VEVHPEHLPQRIQDELGDGVGLTPFGVAKERPIAELVAVFERWKISEASQHSLLRVAVMLPAVVVALHLDLKSQILAQRKLHVSGIVRWFGAIELVLVGKDHHVVTALAHVLGKPGATHLTTTKRPFVLGGINLEHVG
jgi:hypothetical protein